MRYSIYLLNPVKTGEDRHGETTCWAVHGNSIRYRRHVVTVGARSVPYHNIGFIRESKESQ